MPSTKDIEPMQGGPLRLNRVGTAAVLAPLGANPVKTKGI